MFSNRVTTRELFANSSSEKHEYNEQFSDNFSQLQNSQYDFTQYSQDLNNSQQMSNGSDSQGRKIFEKFMASGQNSRHGQLKTGQALHGGQKLNTNIASNGRPVTVKPNFQQQLQLNKSRAKEKDERDLLNSIVNIVKDCSDEVKDAVRSLKDGIGQFVDNSDDRLASAVNSVADVVSQSYDKMIQAVKEKDDRISKETNMEKEIYLREAKIAELEKEVSNLQQQNENQTVSTLKELLDHHKSSTDHKLQHLVDIAEEQLENQRQMISTQDENKKENMQMQERIQKDNQLKYESTEKRVLDEVMQLRDELEHNKNELEKFYRDQMKTLRQKQSAEFQQHIHSGLERNAEISYEQSKELWNLQYGHLNELCKNQQTEIESYFRTQIAEQTRFQQRQYEKQMENQKCDLDRHTELIRDQVTKDVQSDLNARKWDFHESVPKNLQQQLDTMHKNYIKEIDRLRKEMTSNSGNDIATTGKTFMSTAKEKKMYEYDSSVNIFNKPNVYQDTSSRKPQECSTHFTFKNRNSQSSLISPTLVGDGWTSRRLFSKTNPSPVAAVKPQPQESSGNINSGSDKSQTLAVRRQHTQAETPETRGLRRSERLSSGKSDSQNEISQENKFGIPYQRGIQFDATYSHRRHDDDSKTEETKTASVFATNSKEIKTFTGKSYSKANQNSLIKSGMEALRQKYDTSNQVTTASNQSSKYQNPKQGNSIFDFDENQQVQNSVVMPFQSYRSRPERSSNTWKSNYSIKRKEKEQNWTSREVENLDSRDSSPSLSITKVLIEKKVRHPRRPLLPSSQHNEEYNEYSQKMYLKKNHPNDSDDFLSIADLEDTQQTVYDWDNQVARKTTKISRPAQKRKLFHSNINSEMTDVMSSVRGQQKKKKF